MKVVTKDCQNLPMWVYDKFFTRGHAIEYTYKVYFGCLGGFSVDVLSPMYNVSFFWRCSRRSAFFIP